MPAGIDTPGFLEEEKEKPAVTRKIEESDEQISPQKCAEYLIAGGSFSPFSSLPGHPSFLVLLPTPVTPLCLSIPPSIPSIPSCHCPILLRMFKAEN